MVAHIYRYSGGFSCENNINRLGKLPIHIESRRYYLLIIGDNRYSCLRTKPVLKSV